MMQMSEPQLTHLDALKACKEGVKGNLALLKKIRDGEKQLISHGANYRKLALSGMLHTLNTIQGDDPIIVEKLKKSDLIKIYDYYFRNVHPGRAYYEKLLASANEKCPLCGGIGRPRNLDHFLPKAHFSQFSVLPVNLIPSCRDCNMDGKGQAYAKTAETQIIHPYLEASHFFKKQWIFAKYIKGSSAGSSRMDYYVDPPSNWSSTDKKRVKKHFIDFDLAIRYATEASPSLTEIEAQIKALLKASNTIDPAEIILQPIIAQAPFINHWKRVMCISIIESLKIV